MRCYGILKRKINRAATLLSVLFKDLYILLSQAVYRSGKEKDIAHVKVLQLFSLTRFLAKILVNMKECIHLFRI